MGLGKSPALHANVNDQTYSYSIQLGQGGAYSLRADPPPSPQLDHRSPVDLTYQPSIDTRPEFNNGFARVRQTTAEWFLRSDVQARIKLTSKNRALLSGWYGVAPAIN